MIWAFVGSLALALGYLLPSIEDWIRSRAELNREKAKRV